MRRIAWVLVFSVAALLLSGCHWNWSDPFHPRVCPKIPTSCAPNCCP